MALKTRPARVDACIIGAGASGAAAAKVLTEKGVRVVALERGPWRGRETFGGDELANVNRHNLWPDSWLNPRTARASSTEDSHLEMFCPVPQMVGGGTVHWQGWLPRFTPNDFRLRTIAGELKGATLADWPISYDELEPYYAKVEWAFGVSGRAGANRFEGPRSVGYPCPPLPLSRYAEKFHKGCDALGWNAFPTPQAALSRHLQRPQADRHQRLRAAAWRSHGNAVQRAQCVRARRGEDRPLRSAPRLLCPRIGARGGRRSEVGGLSGRGWRVFEQEADVFILACGAVESARLLLLSKSGRFPNGLANGSDLVGRNATFHEYSAAVGLFDDPIHAWAGGGYVSSSSFQFYEHDATRGHVSGGHLACAGVGIPLPINWRLPDAPTWGAAAKQNDRDNFNHSMAVAMVLHDMPRHDNRVDLDDKVSDAWGLPAARITLTPHDNDLTQGRFLIDRAADILGAAGSKTVQKVYATRVTGNCSHQHGTLRMGGRLAVLGARQILPRARSRQSLRRRWLAVPDGNRSQSHPDDHGERLARGGTHRREPRVAWAELIARLLRPRVPNDP